MKKILIPVCGLALLAGCNFLQKEPLTSITPNNFFGSGDDAEASITACYDALQGAGAYGQDMLTMGEMPTDNCTSNNTDVNALRTISWTPGTSQVGNVYRQFFLSANRANIVLKYVPTVVMDTMRRRQILGEARFVRALSYFNLVRAYGAVPLRLQPTETTAPSELNLPRTPADQVYNQVVADLTAAAVQMPASNPNRAGKNAANALLARVQLTQRNWAAAQAAAAKVIANNIALNSPFKSLFPAENKGPESLFEIQFAGSADGGNLIADEVLPLPIATYSYAKFNVPSAELIAFADTVNDKRWAFNTIIRNSSGQFVGRDHVSYLDAKNVGVNGANGNDRGPFVYKWTSIGNGFNSVDNVYVLRYAEVLLTYAEAVNEQSGPSQDVLNKLNLVRQRAGLAALTLASAQAATKTTMRAEIERQRRLEFAFEGERWWDLVRYARHTLADASATHTITALDIIAQRRAGGARDVNFLVFPIPQAEINTNPQVQQNPGY
ncbi:RagB/SusD family nutrient uptake outer membrane protein [Hymenobacter convexus]|uniref:RagB/SusD family nutrient uptake outer membrane protein n=1 Tax=Hymenobacter sp. CA1UV-4 TaxID=3063782 RepID=UPI002713876E|nr:RagB/SusD family nutrient uptake outer membrane protein [Hymenobacter sp. CA1UV-4]MDO7849987.1 RagB/SusD family nutrient uptake outer membrane protein [Hymenobacter sp. CA1UV-4]